jgi:hypothetical protein
LIIATGANPIYMKRGIDKAVEAGVSKLLRDSKKVSDREEVRQVATVSANCSVQDGKYVVVRGLADRYSNATFNGVPIPRGDIGYNNPKAYTPNMDNLAQNGALFTNHYVMAQCTPTRVALMTGRYPSRFGPHATAAR